jgi:monoamine oxidase
MEVIRKWYPEAPDFINFKRSNWIADPYAKGAWSYMKAGSTPDDVEAYRESDSTGNKVFFAGEATNGEMIATVHGAYISGINAAKDVASEINGDGEDEEKSKEEDEE